MASSARAQVEVPFDPGQVGECANQSSPLAYPGLPFDLVFTENKTLTLGPGLLSFVLQGTNVVFEGDLLDAVGNVIPGTHYSGIAETSATEVQLSQSTTWHGMRFVSDFPVKPGFLVFVTCPVVGQSDPSGNQPPIANAGPDVNGTEGAAVTFDGSGSTDPDGMIATYDWEFGDGVSGTGATPSHTYASAATYNVVLTVTDDDGIPSSDTATAVIGALSQPPVADAGGPYQGAVDAAVTFDGSASSDPDGSVDRYDWDFGDGTSEDDAGATPSHTYAEAGSYFVTLTVTDNSGESDADVALAVIGIGNLPPVADAGGPYQGAVDAAVTFDGSASSDPDGSVDWYDWDFGDGTSEDDAGATPSHTYAEEGIYFVTLTVTDDVGSLDTDGALAVIDVPEPSTALLGGSALSALGALVLARRRTSP
jgi:PKD repeat protein